MKYQQPTFSVATPSKGEWPCAHKRKRIEYPYGENRSGFLRTREGPLRVRAHTICEKCGVETHTEYERVR